MTILNRPNDGLFNVLIAIYKLLFEQGELSQERILSLLGPGMIDDRQVRQTLRRWITLGLFSENKNHIFISQECFLKIGSAEDIPKFLPRVLRQLVFRPENNQNFWESSASTSSDFTRGVAWLLAQDAYLFTGTSHSNVEKVESAQVKESGRRMLQNDTRWAGLREWVVFLGFAWEGDGLVIDPSVAIRESLPDIFLTTNTLTATSFLERLAQVLPVLDFGEFRSQIESVLDPREWDKPGKLCLSTSLSRGLKALELSGDLMLDYQSDSGEAYSLIGQNNNRWGAFTHVVCKKVEGGVDE